MGHPIAARWTKYSNQKKQELIQLHLKDAEHAANCFDALLARSGWADESLVSVGPLSWFRTKAENAELGGSPTSDHMYARAFDFVYIGRDNPRPPDSAGEACWDWTKAIATRCCNELVALGIPWHQAIYYNHHVHLAFRRDGNRNEFFRSKTPSK